ncbi:hypothetical protein NE237_015938 [Protea cynaroides]|uniref:Uncharacterized protein n=1 Tax=Protea cynaroides TaxID=273540 RepID=A0A9Q0QRI0_9MAGN|nr:hypothetical protein NE237_015938 [Protea cynaroides]
MARKENQFQPLGVCERLFNFIINTIAAQGHKRITLGPPQAYNLVEIPITGSSGAYSAGEHMGTATKPTEGGGAIIARDGFQTQLQKDVPTGTSSLRKVPLEGQDSKQRVKGPSKDRARGITDPQANGSAGVGTDSEARGSKETLISKGKEEKTAKEKLTKDTEPNKGEKGKAPRSLVPLIRMASNIDEKSDAFIRSRKEALSRSGSDL